MKGGFNLIYNQNIKLRDYPKEIIKNLEKQAIEQGLLSLDITLRLNNYCLEQYEKRLFNHKHLINEFDLKEYDNNIKVEFPSWLGVKCESIETLENIKKIVKDKCSDNMLYIAYNLNKKKTQNKKKLKDYISIMLKRPCIFLTINFNDALLDNTTRTTRHQYVKHYLKSLSPYYIANIDFGKHNEREHYHALVVADSVPTGKASLWVKKGRGCIYALKVYDPNEKKLSEYILKFSNHATKETTKDYRPLYSDGLKKLKEQYLEEQRELLKNQD